MKESIYLLSILISFFSTELSFLYSQELWSPTSTGSNVPDPRSQNSTVWTGNKMIIWGGQNPNNFLNSGGIYNFLDNSWNTTNTIDAPSPRYGHTAVWTGVKMIIWGGRDYIRLHTGGIYNPLTDTWAYTTSLNAPSDRFLHVAVWTGSKMIVWGGEELYNNVNTGGIYDLITDSWSQTSIVNSPTPRNKCTAIWTGNKMIVWGGNGDSTNRGGIYDPITDTWTRTAILNAPSQRIYHTAIWTGSKMIIWGGYDLNNNTHWLNTGGIYDIVTDTWTSTAITNSPSARYSHTAVWTGTKMIVWGGYDGNNVINTGGIYDPISNTWTATTTNNAPSSRADPSGVWTGNKMIIWGGYGVNGLNTGGIYSNPAVIGIKEINGSFPSEFYLSQNYPNPFNPTTKIRFALPMSSFVKLVVYDMLGRELDILVNEQLNAGTYETNWSADKFSSGIYYYKLVVGDNTNNGGFTETKKMVLIK